MFSAFIENEKLAGVEILLLALIHNVIMRLEKVTNLNSLGRSKWEKHSPSSED